MKKTAVLIMIITIISKIFGFLRDLTLSYYYGASDISDAYLIALTIPGVIFAFIGVGINNGFIPMYAKIESEEGVKVADRFTSNFTNIVLIFTFFMFTIGMVFTQPMVKIFASGFSGDTLKLAVDFSRITLFGIFFTGLVYIYRGYLQVKDSFLIPSMIGFPLNFVTVIAIVLSSKLNIKFLVVGTLIATISQFLFMMPSVIKKGYKHSFVIDFKDENIKNILIIVLPIIIGSSVDQINILIDRTLASIIAVGGISALNYANKLNGFVQGLFILSIVTVMYPMISKMAVKKDFEDLKKSVTEVISAIMIVVLPASAMAMVFSDEIVDILFGRGKFDSHAAELTSGALFFLAIGMIGFGLREVLSRVFYSMQDTKTPVINGAIAMAMNIVLNIILSSFMGINGLALATSLSAIVCTLLLGYSLVKKIGSLQTKKLMTVTFKVLISIVPMVAVSMFAKSTMVEMSTLINFALSAGLGSIVYIVFIMIQKVVVFEDIKRILKKEKV